MSHKYEHVSTGGGFKVLNDGTETEVISQTGLPQVSPRLAAIQETIALADLTDGGTTAATYEMLSAIPKGAIATQSFINAVTGFAGDTSCTLTIGDGTDVDRYNTGTPSVFATADTVSAGAVSGTAFHAAAVNPTLTFTAATEWGDVTGGQVTVTIFYYDPV